MCPQIGLWKALKIRFQRLFKADTFLDVKLIPPCGRTKVQGKFVYFRFFLAQTLVQNDDPTCDHRHEHGEWHSCGSHSCSEH